MVKFSCFSPLHYHRSKKVAQQSGGAMESNSEVISHDQVVKVSTRSVDPKLNTELNNLSNSTAEHVTSPSSFEGCCKSEDLHRGSSFEDNKEVLQMLYLKKSQSLGSVLDKGRNFSGDDATEDDEVVPRLQVHGKAHPHVESAVREDHDDPMPFLANQQTGNSITGAFNLTSEPNHHESLSPMGSVKLFDGEQHDDSCEHLEDHATESGHTMSDISPLLSKSCSLTNLREVSDHSSSAALVHKLMGSRARSFDNLCPLKNVDVDKTICSGSYYQKVSQEPDSDGKFTPLAESKASGEHNVGEACLEITDSFWNRKNTSGKESAGCDFHGGDFSDNAYREYCTDGAEVGNHQDVLHLQNWDGLTSQEFNIKRIEEWISQIDIENGPCVEEIGTSSSYVIGSDSHTSANATAVKLEARSSSPGMEVAYSYIASLSPTTTSAQMPNLGLVVIPMLSAFANLRVLNLSGNAIARITAGALPKSLQMLNLSRNNMSVIEGLRDLTRLRVLDISFNRISRIGHGLASCSSIKELNLAGNKISEVEGLHRLLKLNFLDLSANKISTSKGLGQLAANTSLQAINLDGNPAQRNVGDEQLKRYLLSLFPNLVYFNKQNARASSSKEVSDRSGRSIATLQFDRDIRSSHKPARRGHGSSHHKGLGSSSSSHGRSSHAGSSLLRHSKGRHDRLHTATRSKATHMLPSTSKLSSQPSDSLGRASSEGAL